MAAEPFEEVVGMEWLGLLIWALIALVALPLAIAGTFTALSLGLQSLFAVAGLAFCVVFLVIDGDRWPAWVSFGLALTAAAAVAAGTKRVISDEPRTASAGQAAEEVAATLAGVELPLLLTVAFFMALAGSGVTTVG